MEEIRYVDDIFEVVKEDDVGILTVHLNSIDTTRNGKFTHEKEENGHKYPSWTH